MHSHGFSNLLRRANAGHPVEKIARTPGAKPEMGGSAQRVPGDKSTIRHMDAKDRASSPKTSRRGSRGPRMRQKLGDAHEGRIARGSAGTSGRVIHHAPHIEREGGVPEFRPMGAKRNMSPGHETHSKKLGSSGMSDFVKHKPGVPAHKSVINRSGGNPGKADKLRRYPYSATRKKNIAAKIQM
jgi:hypothetical protein